MKDRWGRAARLVLAVTGVAGAVVVMVGGFGSWRAGRVCDEFAAGSERREVCLASGADPAQVCFNLQSVPFMCSAEFLRGHPPLLQRRQDGLAGERRRCAIEYATAEGCRDPEWEAWCSAHYRYEATGDKNGGEDHRRHDRCVRAGGG